MARTRRCWRAWRRPSAATAARCASWRTRRRTPPARRPRSWRATISKCRGSARSPSPTSSCGWVYRPTALPPKRPPTRSRPTRPTRPAASPPIDAPRSSSNSSAQGKRPMDDSEFHRLKRLPPYVFAEVNAMKARARAAGQDVVDLGMGNPDLPTAPHIVAKLAEAAGNPRAHGYSASRGIPGLRKAQAAYYARRFGVELDPENEIIVTLGSKEGLANLAQAITSPGDIVLVPNPSYPIHPYGFIIAGGSVRHIPVPGSTSIQEFLPALERAVQHAVPKPLALVLHYPSNPTAQVVDLDFYAAIVDFCKRQGIWILSDLAYAEIYFDGVPPPSVLQVPGAREIAIEFTSMSKTYSMAGWRIGFAAGNRTLIQALTRIKSYLDYGACTAVQFAPTAARNGPQDCIVEARNTY